MHTGQHGLQVGLSRRRRITLAAALASAVILLVVLPTGFEMESSPGSRRVRALVLSVDNTGVQQISLVTEGVQELQIRILSGDYRGEQHTAVNTLYGKREFDTLYREGDRVLTVLETDQTGVYAAAVMGHYRIFSEAVLFLLFALVLILFARWSGVRTLFSFLFAALLIWKAVLPAFLRGANPLAVSVLAVSLLTALIIFMAAGLTRTGLSAVLGALAGVVLILILSLMFGSLFRISGAQRPFAETLLYTGFEHLDLSRIFLAGILISASGAVMDMAVDVAASQREVQLAQPGIPRGELIRAGMNVGRSVIGTMTTTLLLAYSGGYTTMLMVFLAQGTPALNMLNLHYLAAELLHTLVGSLGLVAVAPLTALLGGWVFTRRRNS